MNEAKLTKIKNEANRVLFESREAGNYPVSAESIARYLGYECHYFAPNKETNNISGAVNHTLHKIYINPKESPKRQLFTLAHEIGHIVLHNGGTDHIDYRTPHHSFDQNETDADYFAANLLMPEEMFIYKWKELERDIYKLSDFFGVSTSAIGVRAESLQLE